MRLSRLPKLASLALVSVLALAACESDEERAQSHYERAVALVAEGEPERAAIELRNALQADGDHAGARLTYARLLRDQGDAPGAIAQYLRVVEADPDHAEAHRALAELALQTRDVRGVELHAQRAFELDPDTPEVRALKASLDFRRGETAAAVAMAEGVLAEAPGNVAAHLVVIAERLAQSDYPGALARADAALAIVPEDEELHLARLAALGADSSDPAVGAQLARMVELFPGNPDLRRALLQWHVSQGNRTEAVAILRDVAAQTPDDPEGHLNVAQFLLEIEGPDAARAELERLVESRPESRPFRRALAQLDFAAGEHDAAIAAMETLVAGEETSPEIRDLQVALARMLLTIDRRDDSVALIDAVLAEDPRHVEALKMRARWHVEADRTEAALLDLRAALTEAPEDPEIMTLMAMAHEREGATEQVGERLARAFEASNAGIGESLRYARFLMREDRVGQAESVVLDGLRRAPEHPELLMTLGQVHLQRSDWARARQVAGLLRNLGTPAGTELAASLELAALQGEGRTDDMVGMLEGLAGAGDGNLRARIGLIQARLAAGDTAAAEAEVAAMLAEDPASLPARMIDAGLMVMRGETAEAEAVYRTVITERPELREPYQILFALLAGLGRGDEATALLDQGIEATGRDGELVNTKAGLLYVQGDFEGTIALYEELYARDTANVVSANNLASMLSAYRDDPESLERAFQVARRLRGTEVPHFQDTYGWILVRRGDHQQALTYLEPAAAALATDPLVQYHLGRAYLALERWEDARAAFTRSIEVAGPESPLPQVVEAQNLITEIDARPPEPEPAAN